MPTGLLEAAGDVRAPAEAACALETDVAIVGAGLAGSLLALVLARRGVRVAVADPHALYPDDFRCEKLTGDQVRLLAELGVLGDVVPLRGRTGGEMTRLGFRYDALVNGLRSAWPAAVAFRQVRVAGAVTGPDRQTLRLADGGAIGARLLVLATGGGERLRAALGVERRMISERHSLCIGASLEPAPGRPFPFEALNHFGERAGDGVAYASLFRLDGLMRINLFCHRDVGDEAVRRLRDDFPRGLREMMPALSRRLGAARVLGPVELRSTSLYRCEPAATPGVVLIGDAFQNACPATGKGVTRILTDVSRLADAYLPAWLATPGMGADKTAAYARDPARQAVGTLALRQAERGRALALGTTPYWRARRTWSRIRRLASRVSA